MQTAKIRIVFADRFCITAAEGLSLLFPPGRILGSACSQQAPACPASWRVPFLIQPARFEQVQSHQKKTNKLICKMDRANSRAHSSYLLLASTTPEPAPLLLLLQAFIFIFFY